MLNINDDKTDLASFSVLCSLVMAKPRLYSRLSIVFWYQSSFRSPIKH